MNLKQLRYAVEVERTGSITQAAKNLYAAQPNLSRSVRELEEELGKKLFIRGKRKVSLTEDGLLLRRRAQEIVELADQTEAAFHSSNEFVSGDVHIGGGETDGMRLIARAAKRMERKYPEVRYHLFSGNADGTFAPESNMTYAQFLVVLSQFSGDTISPVEGGVWYDGYVNWAKEQELIPQAMLSGFDPNAAITRQDMAALFGTFLEAYNPSYEVVNDQEPSFPDQGAIADYAADGVTACLRAGIMSGNADGSFNPTGTATRAQVAVTMVQMARVMGK